MNWPVITGCALIIAARIADVSLGTLRTVMVVQGRRSVAFVLGFFEVLIWITVVGQLIAHLDHWAYYPAYALGFASGNFMGITLEKRLAFGTQVVRIFSRQSHAVATSLRAMTIDPGDRCLAVTEMQAQGHKGPIGLLFAEVPRKFADSVVQRALTVDPEAYYVIDDVRQSSTAASRSESTTWWRSILQRK